MRLPHRLDRPVAMAGFLIFVGIRFKPHGLYCIPGLVILFLLLAYPVYINRSLSGGSSERPITPSSRG